jgi:hypothetical protein
LTAGALVASGLAGLMSQASPAQAAVGMRVSMIGAEPMVSIMDAGNAIRATISSGYPNLWVDGTACRGSVRSSCQNAPPAKGLPASAFDVIKANTGQLGDAVVLMTGYDDLIASPNQPVPDMTPFNADFTTLMNALQAEASVQQVLMLNLRSNQPNIPALQVNKYNAINDRLAFYDTQFSKLSIAPWNTYSAGLLCPPSPGSPGPLNDENCFQTDDGVTPRSNVGGAQGLATFLRQQLDALPGAGTNPIEPAPVGSRCLPGNAGGFAPWSYQGSGGYPPPPPAPQLPTPGRFRSIDPVRLLDTRAGDGDPWNRMVGLGRVHRLQVTSELLGIPPSAVSASLNVTVAGSCGSGFVTVYPCGPTGAPNSSNLNYLTNQIVPNAVTVRIGTLGRVCLYTNQQADLVVDINGYYDSNLTATGVAGHAGAAPTRVVDTRPGTPSLDPGKVKVAANSSRLVNLVGLGAVPAGSSGVVLNVTATEPEGSGFLTVFPASGGGCVNRPNASNVNYTAGQTVPNYAAVRVPGNGQICVYTLARSHIVIDRVGSFGGGGTNLLSSNPARLVDTRAGFPAALGIKGRLQPFTAVEVNIGAAGVGLPGGADAAILNVTAVQPSQSGFISIFPCGPWPGTSNLNFVAGEVRPNQVDAQLSNGRVCVLSNTSTDVVIDLLGWYSS